MMTASGGGGRGAIDAGQPEEALQQLFIKRGLSGNRGVLPRRDAEIERGDPSGFETGPDALQLQEAAHEEAGADQQHERDGHLADQKQAAEAAGDRPAGGAAVRLLERLAHLGPRGLQGRHEAEQHAGQQRQGDAIGEDGAVDRQFPGAGQEIGGDPDQPVEAPIRQQHPEKSRERRREHALDQELADDPAARGPEGEAHRDLLAAGGETGEQQVGDVGARDEQHETDRGQQHQQGRPAVAHQVLVQQHGVEPGLGVDLVGKRRGVTAGDDFDLVGGLRERDAGFETALHQQVAGAAVDQVGRQAFEVKDPGGPRLGLVERKTEPGRQDADDRLGYAVEREALAEDGRVGAESFLPDRMSEQHDRRAAGPVFVRGEHPAEQGTDAEGGEKIGRDPLRLQLFGIAASGQGEGGEGLGRHAGEHLLLVAQSHITQIGDIRLLEAAVGKRGVDAHEPGGLGVREGPQEHGVDGGKNDDVRAQSESQRGKRQGGETGRFGELAEGEFEILHGRPIGLRCEV